eukprot:m.144438 g.144438  ORF g.144438 m.144438 type:complete len:52 (-) comp14922_c0_seq4:285-440(-)
MINTMRVLERQPSRSHANASFLEQAFLYHHFKITYVYSEIVTKSTVNKVGI